MKNQYNEEKPRLYSFEFLRDKFKVKDRTEGIVCDHCGKHLCIVHNFDLEESYFLCDDCYVEMDGNKTLLKTLENFPFDESNITFLYKGNPVTKGELIKILKGE